MQFVSGKLGQIKTDLIVIPVSSKALSGGGKKGKKSHSLDIVERLIDVDIVRALKREKFEGKPGQSALFRGISGAKADSVLVVGVDDKQENSHKRGVELRKLGSSIVQHAERCRAAKVLVTADHFNLKSVDDMVAFEEGAYLGTYRFDRYKSKKKSDLKKPQVTVLASGRVASRAKAISAAITRSIELTRDLVNTPPADCVPRDVVAMCRKVARKNRLSIQVYNKARLKKMKAGLLLAVAQGSEEPPFMIRMSYRPRSKPRKVIALVGKGVTFDSGGLSIKPWDGMITMKCDMAGAGAVIGVLNAVAALKPDIEVRGYIPTTENMINGKAVRPGDVVRSMNGKTVEILNTDAEGRLILADALCLAEREKPDTIIDLATLTGACVVALGSDYAGLFTDDEGLSRALIEAGDTAGELMWRLPLANEYEDRLKSPIADLKNIGGRREAGATMGALFLREFVGKVPWAHLDIAGPAFADGDSGHIKRGGTGFGVGTLVRYILSL